MPVQERGPNPRHAAERTFRVEKGPEGLGGVDAAMLKSIESDAPAAFTTERQIMGTENGALLDYLDWNVSAGLPDGDSWMNYRNREQYMRGALTAYRIFRAQSQNEQGGKPLPSISQDIIEAHKADSVEHRWDEKARSVEEGSQERSVPFVHAERLQSEDEGLTYAIKRITRLEVSSTDALYGAEEVSILLNKAYDSAEMDSELARR